MIDGFGIGLVLVLLLLLLEVEEVMLAVTAAGDGDDAAGDEIVVDLPHARFPAVEPVEESRRTPNAAVVSVLLAVVLPRRAVVAAEDVDVEQGAAAVDEDRWKLGTDSESTIVSLRVEPYGCYMVGSAWCVWLCKEVVSRVFAIVSACLMCLD